MSVIEVCISHDQSVSRDQLLTSYPHFLKQEVVELVLSRKYLEHAAEVLQQMQSPADFNRDSEHREQMLNQALGYMFKNALQTDLETSLKLLIQNYLYI